jgi:hypothetical protein
MARRVSAKLDYLGEDDVDGDYTRAAMQYYQLSTSRCARVRAGVRVRVRSAACDMDSGHPSLLNRDDTKQFEAVWKRLPAVRAPLESVV